MASVKNIENINVEDITFTEPENVDDFIRSGIGLGDHVPEVVPVNGKYHPDENYIYLVMNNLFTYGISPSYEMKKPQTPENINGYQIAIPMTSKDTVHKPTDVEKQRLDFFLRIKEKLVDFMMNNKDKLPTAYKHVPSHEEMDKLVKCPMSRKKIEEMNPKTGKLEKTREDVNAVYHLYLPMIWYKKSGNFVTEVRGPGDVKLDPMELINVRGNVNVVIRLSYVSYGKMASFKFHLHEISFTPQQQRQRMRILPPLAEESLPQETQDDVSLEEEEEMVEVKTKSGTKMITRSKYNELKKKKTQSTK